MLTHTCPVLRWLSLTRHFLMLSYYSSLCASTNYKHCMLQASCCVKYLLWKVKLGNMNVYFWICLSNPIPSAAHTQSKINQSKSHIEKKKKIVCDNIKHEKKNQAIHSPKGLYIYIYFLPCNNLHRERLIGHVHFNTDCKHRAATKQTLCFLASGL